VIPAKGRWSWVGYDLRTPPTAYHVEVAAGWRGGYPARQTDHQKPFTDGAAYTPYPL